jgi:3-hydroxyisobutyrate dehydrogenase-like beta-hydroxyacid dehydrogenase
MGAAVGSALRPRAGAVVWAAAGRSQATSKRAELADLVGVPDVAALARRSDVVISVCPPHAARAVADEVAAALDGPLGVPLPDGANAASGTSDAPNAALAPSGGARRPIYVDANAVSPATVRAIADRLGADRVVDAAIIGPPAWERGHTVLWLSGAAARDVAALFAGSPFDARVLGPELGTASALKACFALQSKALPAIWLELAAAARGYGVEEELRGELERHGVDLAAALRSAAGGAEKAWRWAGEMDEAADAVAAAGLPDGFSRAAAEIYRRLADGRLTP